VSDFYNDHEPFAVRWLENLIAKGLIPHGHVDNRPIDDLEPSDLRGYAQCHFFAGIGGWPHALRLAGWRGECWTGSPPCQSFSDAGARLGFEDERHLWPEFFRLIRECRPPIVFGEQVATAIRYGWLDLVASDLESIGYSLAAAVLPAACVGAPHRRERLFFGAVLLADARHERAGLVAGAVGGAERQAEEAAPAGHRGAAFALADADDHGEARGQGAGYGESLEVGLHVVKERSDAVAGCLGDSERAGQGQGHLARGKGEGIQTEPAHADEPNFWGDARWIGCSDGKLRQAPAEPSLRPLADGIQNRVGILRGAGNAIVPQAAAEFIKAFLAAVEEQQLDRASVKLLEVAEDELCGQVRTG
jgi:DNA (cytosine-5)-methyltransferase 1